MVDVEEIAVSELVYTTVEFANSYLANDIKRFEAWSAIDDAKREQFLIAAQRRLNLLEWRGTQTTPLNAWPRSGVTQPNGDLIPEDVIPNQIAIACSILAGSIAIDPTLAEANDTSHVEQVGAGEAKVRFFKTNKNADLLKEPTVAAVISSLRVRDDSQKARPINYDFS